MLTPRRTAALVGSALALAAGAGGLASHVLIGGNAAVTSLSAAEQNAKAPVPFLGPFAENHKGYAQCGPAVRLMEGALRNAKVRSAPPTNCVGKATTKQLIRFQRKHKIPASGIYGRRTHEALSRYYTPKQRLALSYLATRRLKALQRSTILIVTAHAQALGGLMGYCDFGSLQQCTHRGVWPAYPDVPRHTDCSGYVSWVFFQAGLPNPNGSGVGTTKTLIDHGTPVGINGPLKIGDLIYYGYNNSHVAIYIGHGLVSSHGQPGIAIHPYGYRTIYAIRRMF